ncbi:MAG: hypothetical protein WEC34_07025 [Acidimicrobiia bacterium]
MRPSRCVAPFVTVLVAVLLTAVPALGKGVPTLDDRREIVFRETSGITMRAFTGKGDLSAYFGSPGVCDGPGCLPKRCQPIRMGYVALSTRTAVGEGFFEVYRRQGEPLVFASAGSFGAIVSKPVGWVVVRTAPGVESVEARFLDGRTDSVRPSHGFALLASPLDHATLGEGQQPQIRVTARRGDGAKPATLLVRNNTPWPGPPEECSTPNLPQQFPETTGREPADPEGARAAIVDAFDKAYGGAGTTGGEGSGYVEDGESLREVTQIAADKFPELAAKVRAHVDEVRFVDADEAAVQFQLGADDPMGLALPGGIGTAVLRDGRWLVSRATFCSLLAFGGTFCPLRDDARSDGVGPRLRARARP